MSASGSWLSNISSEFLGGGISIHNAKGKGFSTVLDPATGTYKTNISTGGVNATVAGIGQTPGSFTQNLSTIFSSSWVVLAVGAVLIILILGTLRRRI